jgi:hypothetical protein
MRSLTAVSQADTSTRTVRALAAMGPGGRERWAVAGSRGTTVMSRAGGLNLRRW